MTTEIFKLPTKVIDGVVTTVDISTWANITLDSANLALFVAAEARENELWEAAVANGTITSVVNVDANGNPVAIPSVVWPQIITVIDSSGNQQIQERYANGTSNVAYTAGIAQTLTVINHTLDTVSLVEVDTTGNVVSSNIAPPPKIVGAQVTWDDSKYQSDPELVAFRDQYMADPTLTWPA